VGLIGVEHCVFKATALSAPAAK
jgi:hypothetical protein